MPNIIIPNTSVEFFDVFESIISTDETHSRGNGYFSTEALALAHGKGAGWYGGNGGSVAHRAVSICEHVYVLANAGFPIDLNGEKARLDAELREKTLAGLSDEQVRVLGLKR